MTPTWIDDQCLPGGRLGLVHSPGFREATRDQDLHALRSIGVEHIVCLQEASEFQHLLPPETVDQRRAAVELLDMTFTHSPIVDTRAPNVAQACELVALINAQLGEGRTVIVHCWAGLGRAGTIAACVLTANGVDPQMAITSVRNVRPGAIESVEQEQFVNLVAQV